MSQAEAEGEQLQPVPPRAYPPAKHPRAQSLTSAAPQRQGDHRATPLPRDERSLGEMACLPERAVALLSWR